MSQDHTNKQFDVEMEGIRSGVLSMGGMVEKQLTRAIRALAQEEDADLLDAVGDQSAADQHRSAMRANHRATAARGGGLADGVDG
jgi:phosphate uptake regulator